MPQDLTPFARRLVPARPEIAAEHLRGKVAAGRFAAGRPHTVMAGLLDLTLDPAAGAERATQLLHGETFTVYDLRDDGLAWGQAALDGYVGFVAASGLGPRRGVGRRITSLWSHIYEQAGARSRVLADLPFLAEVPVSGTTGGFSRLRGGGHVPTSHLAPVVGDHVAVAERFIGAPYLWGGRSVRGIDCSGLVQVALIACDREAPRDSDMQAALVGKPLPRQAALRRGDLVFWKGHVGIMQDAGTLLHANGFHMSVVAEPLTEAALRIAAGGGGPILLRRRP